MERPSGAADVDKLVMETASTEVWDLWCSIGALLEQFADADFVTLNVKNPLVIWTLLDDMDMINRMNLGRYQLMQQKWEDATIVEQLKCMEDQLLHLHCIYFEAK